MVFGETVHNQMLALSLSASMGLQHGLCITHLVLRSSMEGEPGMDQGREWEEGGRWRDGGGLLSSFAHYLLPRSLAGITRVTTPVNPTDRPRPPRHARRPLHPSHTDPDLGTGRRASMETRLLNHITLQRLRHCEKTKERR